MLKNSSLIELQNLEILQRYQIIEVGKKTAEVYYKQLAYENYLKQHIPDARYVDLADQFSSIQSAFDYQHPGAIVFKRSFEQAGLVWDQPILIYDRSNNIWAARLCWILQSFGHKHSYVLNGGFKRWQQKKLPIQSGLVEVAATHLNCQPKLRTQFFTDLENIIPISNKKSAVQLINVLQPEVFTGKERKYARRGHIPNSINLPFSNFLGADNRIIPPPQNIDLNLEQEIVVYCGSGVAASGAAIALKEMGASNVKVYDGSMSEWSCHPELPLIS